MQFWKMTIEWQQPISIHVVGRHKEITHVISSSHKYNEALTYTFSNSVKYKSFATRLVLFELLSGFLHDRRRSQKADKVREH